MRKLIVCLMLGILLQSFALSADAQERQGQGGGNQKAGIRKPTMTDTVKANMYADNWFVLYINGEQVAVDSIKFIPHNVISVDILPKYPMTIAGRLRHAR